jgi:hypothetical protein
MGQGVDMGETTIRRGLPRLALALADEEFNAFQAIFRAALQHPSRQESEALQQAPVVPRREHPLGGVDRAGDHHVDNAAEIARENPKRDS